MIWNSCGLNRMNMKEQHINDDNCTGFSLIQITISITFHISKLFSLLFHLTTHPLYTNPQTTVWPIILVSFLFSFIQSLLLSLSTHSILHSYEFNLISIFHSFGLFSIFVSVLYSFHEYLFFIDFLLISKWIPPLMVHETIHALTVT